MQDHMSQEPIRRRIHLPISQDRAFSLLVNDFQNWWPQEYSWSGDGLQAIGIQSGEGGHCFEIGPHGFRCDWGTVLAWKPPHRLLLAWQIGFGREPLPNLTQASEVEVRFEPDSSGGTWMSLEHRGFEHHGRDAARYRQDLDAPQGWSYILDRYASIAHRTTAAGDRSLGADGQIEPGLPERYARESL